MGQKVNPIGFRLGISAGWKSRWFADKKMFREYLIEDVKLRSALMERLRLAGVTNVEIERLPKSMTIIIYVSRPGIVIGRGGTGLEELKKFILSVLAKIKGSEAVDGKKIDLRVEEVQNPEISAYLVAGRITAELERRLPARRVVNRAIERVMAAGARGIKVVLSGRIGGAEISRTEKYHSGSVPTQTLRADIDYVQTAALLKKGYVGVKVWIYKEQSKRAAGLPARLDSRLDSTRWTAKRAGKAGWEGRS